MKSWLILKQDLRIEGNLINRQNTTHIEYCRYIDIDFWFLPDHELITLKHYTFTSLLGSTEELPSVELPTLDEGVTSVEVSPTETATTVTPTVIVEGPASTVDHNVGPVSRRRRSLNNCEDACYEISLVQFEMSFDLETSNFRIENEDELLFSKIVNLSEMMVDEEVEVYFEPNENFFAGVSKIRYESIPRQYSSLPKRKNE